MNKNNACFPSWLHANLFNKMSILMMSLAWKKIIFAFQEILPEPKSHTSIKTEVISVINIRLKLQIVMRRN